MKTLLKASLAIVCAVVTLSANCQEGIGSQEVPRSWIESVCAQHSRESCIAANAWHWLRQANVIIDPSVKVIEVSGGAYALGLVAKAVVGETPEVQFMLTLSKAGMKAGAIAVAGGIVVAVVGTALSVGTIFLGMTTSTAPRELDELQPQCIAAPLDAFKTPEGMQKFLRLPPRELERLLPCIQRDKDFYGFLVQSAANGQEIQNQIQNN